MTVFAVTDPSQGSKGITAFLVGIRGAPAVELLFHGCCVPVGSRIGAEGEAFKIAMRVLDKSRLGIAAQALGIAAGALAYATDSVAENAKR